MVEPKDGAMALAGAGVGLTFATLLFALTTRRAEAAAPAEVDDLIKQALAAILQVQLDTRGAINDIYNVLHDIYNAANDANRTLIAIANTLGAPAEEKRRILQPFQLDSQTLQSGTPFPIYEKSPGVGALIWAVVDVSSPNCKLQIRFDDLVWEFEYSKLNDQGVDRPLAPGVWLSKYDAVNSHFAMIFSAGTVSGFSFKQRLLLTVTYTGAGTATLNQGRGIAWVEV